MAKRSVTFKQFLLRVHPDHFQNLPKVHEENLHSIKLLNQFMDEQCASPLLRTTRPTTTKVYFSVFLPAVNAENGGNRRDLKRFSLELTSNIESNMYRILKECGVTIPESEKMAFAKKESMSTQSMQQNRSHRQQWQTKGDKRTRSRGEHSGMDFDINMDELYAKAREANLPRRKKRILNMTDFLKFMKEAETVAMQQQRQFAWQSIQSIKGTLKREFGLHDVLFSCDWSSVHLNATVMVLLKTLRQYTRAHQGGSLTPRDFLRGATIDISSYPSGIDVANEYQIYFNPADVPLQWVEVLEKIDMDMVKYMQAAQESLASLQVDATKALGGATILRGRTCSAMSYRIFLQNMKNAEPYDEAKCFVKNSSSVMENITLVVEDHVHSWSVLTNAQVQVPFDCSYSDVTTYMQSNRERIRHQRMTHEANLDAFTYISKCCMQALGLTAITYAEGVPLEEAIVACEELLKMTAGLDSPLLRKAVPPEMIHFVETYTRGRAVCISRTFGLGQDGLFTFPFDWYKF